MERAPMTRRAIDLHQAKLDPRSVFRAPDEVLNAEELSAEDKRAILVRWEADTEALLRATEEGKRSPAELLRVLHEAMRQLDGGTA
jgi:hypothetical protein